MDQDKQSELEFKLHIYEQFSRICKALASARRFELLELLAQGEHTVDQLANETGMSIANTSQHLQQLRMTGLVEARRRGIEMWYRIVDEHPLQLLQVIQNLAEARIAEVDRIISQLNRQRADLKIVALAELLSLLESKQVITLDVRPGSEFIAGHIPNAYHIPLEQIEEKYSSLPQNMQVVVYGRGYYNNKADKAVRILQAAGYNASRLDTGFMEWRAEGYPIEKE